MSTSQDTPKSNLNYIAPINSLGYGQVGYNLLVQLSKLYNVACWPINRQIAYPVPEDKKSLIQQTLDNQSTFDRFAPCLRVWHQFDMGEMIGKGRHIGFPIFELDKLNDREKHHLNSLDEIFVCSWWAQDVLIKELPLRKRNNIHVVPLGVDRSIFYDEPMPKDGPTIFLNVGKWEIRKGHDVLIEAFQQAFKTEDNVELWMMNHNPFLSPEQEKEWHRLYKNHSLGDKVQLIPRVATQEELANIMRRAHCGVFPARAEGWNLEALEMMSCGRHVIITDYAAHKDFCRFNNNAWKIPVTELEEAWDGIWFHGMGQWAKIDVDALTSIMKQVHDQNMDGDLLLNTPGIWAGQRLTWENSAAIIKATIESLDAPQAQIELD